ncbi:hypothetical protein B1A99_19610 [Cohnella sp. CIP 111063]|uniref:response regulator transcription factor n=1 Tax=unclassified Cohnella TaxID=2636738 RepID=UPI000B8C4A5F|nr:MULTISPECIES: response regulator [unclassified Cohnella]OXS56538.1 hypothetical protein B1A99_19610 [Cohnella sp. CIP 111063]PRX68717.1 response regulator receiver domain-containing protein [Cohnella sp. SGD-V74]
MDKILLVEDEKSISRVLSAYLKKAGYEVEPAYDGHQALELFEQEEPALVLLDRMLPGMDGLSVLRRIRGQSDCPVIILSALSGDEHQAEGLKAGADEYICKPFVGEAVVARVQEVLHLRRRV